MSQARCLGDRNGQTVWVTIGYRESLRGYYMVVESQDAKGHRHAVYSSAFRRQLLSYQRELKRLGITVPQQVFRQAAEQGSRHQALYSMDP
ncbi:hypothetical protein A3Q32_18540 [Alcanivorax sp. KX64203]|nr:hypothetical protein A3Q32_18540 [Alcanivorax sp. KX64203]